MNKVFLMGNLGADPELKILQNGNALLNLRLATTKKWVKDGEKVEKTEWHMCTLWGKRAEALHKFLAKGAKLLIEGEIQYSSYEDKDGQKRYKTTINIEEIEFAGGGSGERRAPREDPSDPPRTDPNKGWNGNPAQTFAPTDDSEDLPF